MADSHAIGVDLPPRLAELSAQVAIEIARAKTGESRAALLHEFASEVHVQVIELVLLAPRSVEVEEK